MTDDDAIDPVATSVATYSAHAVGYTATHASKLADRAARFARSLPTPSLILDAGCGPGRDLARFVSNGHAAIRVDLNAVFVTMATSHAPTLHGDLRNLGDLFPSTSFDGVWSAAALVHLVRQEATAVLDQFAVITRPGGKLFVSTRSTAAQGGWVEEPDGRRWYETWEPTDLAGAVARSGFVVDELVPGISVELWATRGP